MRACRQLENVSVLEKSKFSKTTVEALSWRMILATSLHKNEGFESINQLL